MTPMHVFIASAARGTRLFGDLLPWLLLLLAMVVVGGIVLLYLRRTIRGGSASNEHGFTLQDLRDLKASGRITPEEYEQAKSSMIGRLNPPKNGDIPERTTKRPGNETNHETPPK